MTIQVRNVGRDKAAWDVEVPDGADANEVAEQVYKSLLRRKPRPLMSREIDVYYDDESRVGQIVVGGIRVVGEFAPAEAEVQP